MDLRNAISTAFPVELSATAAFDYPTAAALAAFVIAEAEPPQVKASASASGAGDGHFASGTSASPAAGRGGKGDAAVLAGVRAAVEAAIGAPVADDEPLMEVSACTARNVSAALPPLRPPHRHITHPASALILAADSWP